MSKDFNSDMFSAILKANENSMALLEKQLEVSQKQAKRKDIIYSGVIVLLCLLLGGMVFAYANKKTLMNFDYDQNSQENNMADSTIQYNNAAENK